MSSTGAVVHAVGADARTRKLLHDVVRLIAAASRRASGHDSVRTIFVNYGLHLRCGEIQCLVPAYALKIRALGAADHRVQYARSQDLGVVDEVVAAHALKAQLALIGDAVERFGTHNLAVLDQEVKLATGAAVRADHFMLLHDTLLPFSATEYSVLI